MYQGKSIAGIIKADFRALNCMPYGPLPIFPTGRLQIKI
jgi:hypothetical protein